MGPNCFMGPHSACEYQMDLPCMNDTPSQKLNVGMLMIAAFTEIMHVVRIHGNKEQDAASGMIEYLHTWGRSHKHILRTTREQ